jgi:hypothetical protein
MRAGATRTHTAYPVRGSLALKPQVVESGAPARPQLQAERLAPERVGRRLFRNWKSEYKSAVADGELRQAVNALFHYHHDKQFFGIRHEGMQLHEGLGPDGELEVFLAPNRKDGKTESCGCPFCVDSAEDHKALAWRDWRIIVNKFPYAPAQSHHTVLAWEGHREQGCGPKVLEGVLAYQRLVDDGRGTTMHFNGTAGNSESHLHWHASREEIPVERWLDDDTADERVLRRMPGGEISSFTRGPFGGFVVEGDESFVAKWGSRLVDVVAKDDDTDGRYNLLALPQKDGKARLVILPRRFVPDDEELPRLGGAWAAGGREVRYEAELTEDADDEMLAGAQLHVVRPEEIEGVDALLKAPESGVLFARFGA